MVWWHPVPKSSLFAESPVAEGISASAGTAESSAVSRKNGRSRPSPGKLRPALARADDWANFLSKSVHVQTSEHRAEFPARC